MTRILDTLSAVPPTFVVGGAALAALLLLVVAWRLLRGRRPEDVITFIVAALTTGIAAQGMFRFFGDFFDMPAWMQWMSFAVFELGQLACVLRGRRKIRDPKIGAAGIDGVLVWAFAAVSALLSATDATGPGILARLIFPFFAASMWELLFAFERRRHDRAVIHWRITPERILVKLGLAESTARSTSDVDAQRRITRVALAAEHVDAVRDSWAWRKAWAKRRLRTAMRAAVDAPTNLAIDRERQRALMAQLGALHNTMGLADARPPAPWDDDAQDDAELFTETPVSITRWLDEVPAPQPVPDVEVRPAVAVPADVPEPVSVRVRVPESPRAGVLEPDEDRVRAAAEFGDEVRAGRVPGIRAIRDRMKIGQPKAYEVQEYLRTLLPAE